LRGEKPDLHWGTMILRRYVQKLHSVTTNFDSRALSEVGFRRDNETSLTPEDLEEGYERVAAKEITATADGPVQGEAEEAILRSLEDQLRELEADGAVVVVENEQGVDYPKTRSSTSNIIVEGENRFLFRYTVDPPIRATVYRRRQG
jgi:hypothetical protein